MVDEIESDEKIKNLEFRVTKLEREVQQLIRVAQQSANAVNFLQTKVPKQLIRR